MSYALSMQPVLNIIGTFAATEALDGLSPHTRIVGMELDSGLVLIPDATPRYLQVDSDDPQRARQFVLCGGKSTQN